MLVQMSMFPDVVPDVEVVLSPTPAGLKPTKHEPAGTVCVCRACQRRRAQA